ncbi:septal ring lytic transglycosylase RlpA family protein [Roseibium sp. CAU 1637]|uniref:Endolytic peptidoglycan transglycosylase RlpA n=1 Tax=Roseibium limicola TaxID=2816037 RepID=A0A939J5V4_9HYPH|nr:septal ring lytic transglycosylase RlpA family protein [Roseibium limicola]MBO0346220.1 septal ring lytic transglycosylase RlpA family protein [Roseibium limicola]
MRLNTVKCAGLLATIIIALPLAAQASAIGDCGKASWYALTSRTASGEMMDASKLTAAHPNLPFGTRVQVTNVTNGRSVVVRINDRGPFVGNRVIDLSKAAAKHLSFVSKGVTKVCFSTALAAPVPEPRPAAAAWTARNQLY